MMRLLFVIMGYLCSAVSLRLRGSPLRSRGLIAERSRLWFRERSRDCGSGYGDVFILPRCFSADADGANHFSIDDDGHATLQSDCSMQGQGRHASVLHLILEDFAGPAVDRSSSCFIDTHIDAGHLRVV